MAWAKDGIVEGIQDTRGDVFIVGVQWHPELSWADDVLSRELFEQFIRACERHSSEVSDQTSKELVYIG